MKSSSWEGGFLSHLLESHSHRKVEKRQGKFVLLSVGYAQRRKGRRYTASGTKFFPMYSFNKYFLSIYQVPDTIIPGLEDSALNKVKNPFPTESRFQKGEVFHKHNIYHIKRC